MSILWLFQKLQFSGLKTILLYPEYKNTIYSDTVSAKSTFEKKN